MPVLTSRSWVPAPIDVAFAFFEDPANLARIMPPPVAIRLARVEPWPPRAGTEIELTYGVGPFRRAWVIRLVEHQPPVRIVDETLTGPMRRFHHSHTFTTGAHGTWVEDRVDFHVGPDGPIGVVVDQVAALAMRLVFAWRRAMQRRLLRR